MRPFLPTLLLATLLSGCQLWVMPPRSVRPLAAPLSEHHQVARLLTIDWNGHSQRLRCRLITGPGETRMEVLSDTGLAVLRLVQSPAHIEIERSPRLPPSISPDVLLADIQLVFWPADRLAKTLAAPWRLTRHAGGRRLYEGDTLRARVDYQGPDRWRGVATLHNTRYGYRLTLTPVIDSAGEATP